MSSGRNYETFSQFESAMESLTDLLCWAAREGVGDTVVTEYPRRKERLRSCYESVRCELHPLGADSSPDPIAELLAAEDITDVINAGDTIELMMSTQSLVERYRNSFTTVPPA